MSPFWAALLAWCTIGEKMNSLEITALIVSFCGVALIASAARNKSNVDIDESEEIMGMDAEMLQIVGCLCLLI